MIAFIKGFVADVTEDSVIVENQGIGYRIFTTSAVLTEVTVGMEVK